jgi:hypothetical protein
VSASILSAVGILIENPEVLAQLIKDPVLLSTNKETAGIVSKVIDALKSQNFIRLTCELPALIGQLETRFPAFLDSVADRVIALDNKTQTERGVKLKMRT